MKSHSNLPEVHSVKELKPPEKGEMMNNKFMNKRMITAVVGLTFVAMLPLTSAMQANAADCKTSNTCTVPSHSDGQEHQGGEMSTVNVAGPSNRAGQSGAIKNQYSAANTSKSKRNWTKPATLNCAKGSVTMHISDKGAKCPNGFTKKK